MCVYLDDEGPETDAGNCGKALDGGGIGSLEEQKSHQNGEIFA